MVQLRHVRFLFTDRGALDSTPNCVDDIFEAPTQANQNRAWQLLVSLPLEQKAPQVEDLRKALRSPHRMVWAREPLSNGYLDHCHCLAHLNILYVGLARPPSRLVACSPREICFESIQSQKHVYDSAFDFKIDGQRHCTKPEGI